MESWISELNQGVHEREPMIIENNKITVKIILFCLDFKDEILNPTIWDRIISGVPYANVQAELKDYWVAAKLKTAIDRKINEDRIANPQETISESIIRTKEETSEMEKEVIDYFNEENKKFRELERQADIDGRDEDAAFWANERAKTREMEKKDREAIADFWLNYHKRKQEIQDAGRPSNLNFGLLG